MVRRAISTARSRGVVGVMSWISFRPAQRGLVHQRLGLLDRQVGHDQAVEAGGRRLVEKALHAQPMDDRVGDHGDQRRVVQLRRTLGAERPQGLKDVPDPDPALQGTVIARGDDRPVGDRVGVGNPDLDHVRPALDQLVDQDAVVARSGSPAVTNGMRAGRRSFFSREKSVSMRFMEFSGGVAVRYGQ